ncbi:MAG TPA: DUF4383 domain-containing protein [Solirubrobacterales bacterium]
MDASSPARLYATLVGAVLVVAGIIGFFYEASFATGNDVVADDIFGILAVNGWHNVVHILLGLLGLAMAGSTSGARTYCLGVGALYLVLAIWGFLETDNGYGVLIDIVPINTEDNFLHLILGVVGIGAGLATPSGTADRSQPAPAA